jgi:hypothetical protein
MLNQEVILNESAFDESTLDWRDHVIQFCSQSVSKDIHDKFSETMHQAYGSEIFDLLAPLHLCNESDVGTV